MPYYCAVASCTNNNNNNSNVNKKISFHRFPKGKTLRKAWVHACKRSVNFLVDSARVCGDHFEDSDYERDLKAELCNFKTKKRLKSFVVPHLKLTTSKSVDNFSNSERNFRREKRENRRIVEQLLISQEEDFQDAPIDNENAPPMPAIAYNSNKSEEFNALWKENLCLRQKNDKLLKELTNVKAENNDLKNKLAAFQTLFSKNQQNVINKGRCSNWSTEDISKAITLKCISKKAIKYVRDSLKFPLPSDRTIKRHLTKFQIKPGFIELSRIILLKHANIFTDFEKNVILCYDEMKVKSDLYYDPTEDIIRGPYKNVQVLLIRSLVGKWNQPVFYEFDKCVDKNLFYKVIEMVESTGFKVRGFVSDLGPSNQKLLTSLGITENNTSIQHPFAENRHIWAFCDVPHMLKLLRNHLLDEGYKLPSGEIVNRDVFEKIISWQNNDLKYTHKLTQKHLMVVGTERQNVRKAAELLSGTVASALAYLAPKEKHVAEFVRIVNDGFDVLNSRIPFHQHKLKCGYGVYLQEQNEALNALLNLCASMRLVEKENNNSNNYIPSMKKKQKKGLLPFQKGFIISIRSLQGLHRELMTEEGFTYVMSAKCNQDILESYFSQIRGLGRFYDHPLPMAVSQRIKSLLFSRNAACIVKNGNCLVEDSITLSAEVVSENFTEEIYEYGEDKTVDRYTHDLRQQEEEENFASSLNPQFLNSEVEINKNNQNENLPDIKADLLTYLAGYVAYRVKKNKMVSTFVYGHPSREYVDRGQEDWLACISRGALMKPTDQWLKIVVEMEKEFVKFHGESSVNDCQNVMETLVGKLKLKYNNVDEFAIACFVRTRTFIRIKCINQKQNMKRKSYGDEKDDSGRKTKKKFRKLIQ